METATLRRLPLPAAIQLGLIATLLLLSVVAWALSDNRMGGMDAGPGTDPGALGFFIGAWVVMMAAMMFPSIAPMVLMYARVQAGSRQRGRAAPIGATATFVAGYLVSWAGAGLFLYIAARGIDSLSPEFFAWDRAGPYLAGGIIIVAAVYQLTPLKDACLTKCRNPLSFVMSNWRPGRRGALRMGVGHGAWCVGCCIALMAVLFALGVMSLVWMAFVAVLIAIEKLLPWKALANRGIAVLLLTLGLAVALAPERVPGLTVPDSPATMRAMEAMGTQSTDRHSRRAPDSMGDAVAPGGGMRGMASP
jgi:predicted metal-binding membrane protein